MGRTRLDIQRHNITEERRSKSDSARACVGGVCHATAGKQFLHADFDLALEHDVRSHVDHCSGLGFDSISLVKSHIQCRVRVPMFDNPRDATEVASVTRFRRSCLLLWLVELLLSIALLWSTWRRRIVLSLLLALLSTLSGSLEPSTLTALCGTALPSTTEYCASATGVASSLGRGTSVVDDRERGFVLGELDGEERRSPSTENLLIYNAMSQSCGLKGSTIRIRLSNTDL